MKKEIDYEKQTIMTLIKILVTIFKWGCLILGVIYLGFTMSFLILSLVKLDGITVSNIQDMMSYITFYNRNEILNMVTELGKLRVIVAGIGYGFSCTMTYVLTYLLFSKFKILLDEIDKNNIYTVNNVNVINDAFPLTLFIAFVNPIMIFCIVNSTGVFSYDNIEISGIIYVCATYILKVLFEKGYKLEKRNLKYQTEIDNIKAENNEIKMDALKREAEIKTLKKEIKVEKKESKKDESESKPLKKNALKKANRKKTLTH